MRLEIDERKGRTLILKEGESSACAICKEEYDPCYFLNEDKKVYCALCVKKVHEALLTRKSVFYLVDFIKKEGVD